MPLVPVLGDFDHTSGKFVLLAFFLELGKPLSLVLLHEIVIFQIKVILHRLVELLGVHVLPVVILLHLLLLVPKNVLGGGDVLSRLPIALFNVDIFPLCCHSSCHYRKLFD